MTTLANTPAIEGGKKTREEFLVFGAPIIEEDAIESLVESLRSGWIGTGPKVKNFEEDIARFLNIKYAKAVNSCTSALHLALNAAGIGPGDEVIVPSMTFCASVNSILFTGASPVLIDCEYDSLNINAQLVEAAITNKTKAIMPVHMAGVPVDLDPILELAKKHNLVVVEDAAHALEAKYKGKATGTIGDFGCYSFYANKNLTTAEGGMVVTENEKYFETISQTYLHGLSADAWKRFSSTGFKQYEVVRLGFKYNMTDLQASMGLVHLKKIPDYLKTRDMIWQIYDKGLQDLPLKIPYQSCNNDGTHDARHLYIIKLELDQLKVDRDQFMQALQAEGIGVGIHYKPVHTHKFYKESLAFDLNKLNNAQKLSNEILSLPLTPKMNEKDAQDVVLAVKKICNWYLK